MPDTTVLDDLCDVRLHQHDEINLYIDYDESFEQLRDALQQEHQELLFALEQKISQSLTGAIKYAYKLGFRDAVELLQK